jgi:hypothetical protein
VIPREGVESEDEREGIMPAVLHELRSGELQILARRLLLEGDPERGS